MLRTLFRSGDRKCVIEVCDEELLRCACLCSTENEIRIQPNKERTIPSVGLSTLYLSSIIFLVSSILDLHFALSYSCLYLRLSRNNLRKQVFYNQVMEITIVVV